MEMFNRANGLNVCLSYENQINKINRSDRFCKPNKL
ncbi:hypothetical protein SAMN06269250_2677 [Spirosoma fluviale]|uniref:Uncharacterized protein n=1 Tax=Spirosoma fluviale TaxID=1597977 RepID=A0A286FZ24_9BACT|nr:hypothetical protein SAMN06269250_2677 [Spirosoma fluviale]